MKSDKTQPRTIDEYIAGYPEDVRKILERIRTTIRKAAPGAEETIKYQIPAFMLHGNLIYFAAFKKHVGLYPVPRGHEDFKEELAAYEGGKGTAQFPYGKPIPLNLIRRIVKFRIKENLEIVEARKQKKREKEKEKKKR